MLSAVTTVMVTGASFCTDAPRGILPYKAWYPYSTLTPLGFWSAYLHQIIAHAYGASTNAACDTLVYGMIMQLCSQFAILRHRFQLLPKLRGTIEKNIEQREKNQLANFAEQCNRIFDSLICLQFLISSTVLCVSVYRLVQIDLISPDFPIVVMYLLCMLSQIFILCVSGSHVMVESHKMVHQIYCMEWTSLTLTSKKSLIFIIGNCLRPVSITCGTILPLSINSFNQLIKFSYSIFNVLQRSSGVSR
ncbi:odorant receptor 46a-like isoform X2 [Diachasmimorpha longicaudata]|uniref:odorant receptor 46a-like isoform X2 n=1 Tax=Diachasmimorpha longicaudata TaxID=58733 RepID=UPI0030B90636